MKNSVLLWQVHKYMYFTEHSWIIFLPIAFLVGDPFKFKWIKKECCWKQAAYSPRKLEIFASALSHMFFRNLCLQLHKFLILPLGCYDWDCCLSGLKTILEFVFFSITQVMMNMITLIMRAWLQSFQVVLRWRLFWTPTMLRSHTELVSVQINVEPFLKIW